MEYPPCENCGCSTSPRVDPRKGFNPLPAHKCDPATVEAFKLTAAIDGYLAELFEHRNEAYKCMFRAGVGEKLEALIASVRRTLGIQATKRSESTGVQFTRSELELIRAALATVVSDYATGSDPKDAERQLIKRIESEE